MKIIIAFILILWQLPQFLFGVAICTILRAQGKISTPIVAPCGTLIYKGTMKFTGLTLGPYIFIRNDMDDDVINHEIGHSIQSKRWGPFYLLVVGIPSIVRVVWWKLMNLDKAEYYKGWPEKQAELLGGK